MAFRAAAAAALAVVTKLADVAALAVVAVAACFVVVVVVGLSKEESRPVASAVGPEDVAPADVGAAAGPELALARGAGRAAGQAKVATPLNPQPTSPGTLGHVDDVVGDVIGRAFLLLLLFDGATVEASSGTLGQVDDVIADVIGVVLGRAPVGAPSGPLDPV